ncbi:hypothetical protein Salat_1417400 [Sesamum alatum]|uniref:Uncharacterized protein n=1 Tax=Sesamum alatum TaxID=300844 RepID=A0AAE1YA84_9LAMI|nr:hypothetical protein Salat_1417400 [Sesamum alatum]
MPHFDAIAKDEACWEAEQEQQNIAECKRKFSSSGGEVTQPRKGKEAKVIDEAKKKLRENAIQKNSRWMYDVGIPFNAVNYDILGPAIEAIGQYGSGMKPPSYYEVRVKYLENELEHTNNVLKSWKD